MASQAWMWLAAENKVDMVLRWEDWEWWFISSFCTKQLQQNLRFTFSRNHPPTKRTYRETSLFWEDIFSFPKSKLHFLLLWPLKLIKLTLKFKFFKQKALFQIHHVRRLAVNYDHQNHPHYRHEQHKHRGVQAIYRVRWRWPTFALGGCLGKLSVGLFNQPLHHLNHYQHRHSRCWTWWCWVERGLEGSLSMA